MQELETHSYVLSIQWSDFRDHTQRACLIRQYLHLKRIQKLIKSISVRVVHDLVQL